MGKLRQIQVRYDPQQDRILLRMSGGDAEEYRMWVTRRYLQIWWPILVRFTKAEPTVAQQKEPETRRAVLDFQREKAIADADFKTAFREPPKEEISLPLGEEPLLLERIELRKNASGRNIIWLGDQSRRGLEIAPSPEIVHSLSKLLVDANKKAGWGLDLESAPTQREDLVQVAQLH